MNKQEQKEIAKQFDKDTARVAAKAKLDDAKAKYDEAVRECAALDGEGGDDVVDDPTPPAREKPPKSAPPDPKGAVVGSARSRALFHFDDIPPARRHDAQRGMRVTAARFPIPFGGAR